jgi:AcrR family transcriptional regulator
MTNGIHGTGDLTARARIRDAALDLIAERGSARTSVRGIAERAGVSPGLVLHHFTSKDGVFEEVGRWVLELLNRATQGPESATSPAAGYEFRQARMDELVQQVPQVAGYLRHTLLEATPDGLKWFREAADRSADDLKRREQAGMARASSDVKAEAAMLFLLEMAPIILRPFVESALEIDLSTAHGLQRWRNAQAELLTSALYPNR